MLFESVVFHGFDDPLPGAWWARVYPFYRLREYMPRAPSGPRYERKLCPKSRCRHTLPYTAGNEPNLLLGLVGGEQVSDITYTVGLVERLGKLYARLHVIDHPPDYRRNDIVGRWGWPEGVPILTCSLALRAGEEPCTLSLYSAGSQDYRSDHDTAGREPYLKHLDGLVLVVDPLHFSSLAHLAGGQPQGRPTGVALNNLVTRLRKDLGLLDESQKIPTPLAVALAEADVLWAAGLIDTDSLWHLPVFHEGSYKLHLHHHVDGLFGEFIRRYGDGLFNMIVANFQDYAFFGVSVTGSATVGGEFSHSAPFRVEDPVLWLLYHLGVIEGQ